MAWPVTLNGRVYSADDFAGTAYVTGMPDAFEDFAAHAASIHSGLAEQAIDLTTVASERHATITLLVSSVTTVVAGSTVSVNKTFAPGQPIRVSHYTGATLDGFLDGTVTTYNPVTGSLEFYVGSRNKFSAAASYGGASDPWSISIGGIGDTAPLDPAGDYYTQLAADTKFLDASSNLSDVASTATVVSNLGITATVAELNDVCDISASGTFKNSHEHDSVYAKVFTGGTTPTATKAGDTWVNGSLISIATASGTGSWKQVFPAIYS
jgi:hypothetical protein